MGGCSTAWVASGGSRRDQQEEPPSVGKSTADWSSVLSKKRGWRGAVLPPELSLATRTMAACRDIPPHMAAPPDGGHAVTMAHHVGHARCVGGGGILLFFHGQGCCVISSLTHVRVRRFLAPFSRHRGGGYGCWVLRADLAGADLPLPCARFGQRSSSPPLALVPPCFLAFPGLFRGSIPPLPISLWLPVA